MVLYLFPLAFFFFMFTHSALVNCNGIFMIYNCLTFCKLKKKNKKKTIQMKCFLVKDNSIPVLLFNVHSFSVCQLRNYKLVVCG